jgi:hypothetical protein
MPDGRPFADIREFKRRLLDDQDQIARNLVRQLVTYATGSPVRFADRARVEVILQHTKAAGYPVRQLVHEIIQSDLFLRK